MFRVTRYAMASLFLLSACLLLGAAEPAEAQAQEGALIFLVRHAERADDGPGRERMAADPEMSMMLEDPPLSEAGRTRAQLLAEMLADAALDRVFSTNYRRTRETGQPVAEAAGLEVEPYDASDLEAFAEELRSTSGRHLVVGHSNTTPELVRALGGDPGPEIEPLEYDRLYVLYLGEAGTRTLLIRFGEGYEGEGG